MSLIGLQQSRVGQPKPVKWLRKITKLCPSVILLNL